MTALELQTALHQGQRVYGSLITSTSPRMTQEIKKANMDFVFIDTEHTAVDREKLSFLCQTYSGQGLPTIVRILEPDPFLAIMVIDAGASGVLAPYIETPEQVRQLVGAVKMRPLKGNRLQAALAGEPLDPVTKDYLKTYNKGRMLFLNIESQYAMDRLDELISIE